MVTFIPTRFSLYSHINFNQCLSRY